MELPGSAKFPRMMVMEVPVDPKPRPNNRMYVEILRRMSPAERLAKAFELSEFTRS